MPKRSARRIRDAVAAGGVVIRRGDRGDEVVIAGREGMWVLPKGTPDPGSTCASCVRLGRSSTGSLCRAAACTRSFTSS
ncbi:MAG: hypothetical protein HYY42_01100 [Chloroflexi bacterium]|nr:hypothetical protein [Chloroflexota bacterium]